MSAIVVVVTQPEFDKAPHVFGAPDSPFRCVPVPSAEAEISAAIRELGAVHAIVGIAPYAGPLYEALRPGAVIARFGVGHDGIDKARATLHGILCANTPGALDESVAEQTLALLLAATRHTTVLAPAVKSGLWAPRVGRELHGRNLIIVGCGPIGSSVARIAKDGFGMRVTGLVRSHAPFQPEAFSAVTRDVAAALRQADFVSLHVPATPANFHMVGPDWLAKLSSHAWLINTARGAVVDEAALFDALSAGKLAGAALDVFETEPYRPVDPSRDLRTLDNVIMTPHVGSNTEDANTRMAVRALWNIELARQGRFAEMDLLNREVCARLPHDAAESRPL